jgi:hypothetical protein
MNRNLFNAKGHIEEIYVGIRGGLGNQLFQAAGGSHYAKILDTELFLDDYYLRYRAKGAHNSWLRKFDLGKLLGIDVKFKFRGLTDYAKTYLGIISQPESFHELEILNGCQLSPRFKIESFFQNSKYVNFNLLNSEALDKFNPITKLKKLGYDEPQAGASAVHIRLGDYLYQGTAEPFTYYYCAIEELMALSSTPIYVYSDDTKLASEILIRKFPERTFIYPEKSLKMNPLSLLVLLSKYPYFVGSMSTISWWAAALNFAKKDKLIFPKRCQKYYSMKNVEHQVFL